MRLSRLVAVLVLTLAVAEGAWAQTSPAPVPFTGSAWRWGFPQPHGEGFGRLDMEGHRGYALGDGDTVFVTGDGGSTFSPAASPGVLSGGIDETTDQAGLQALDADSVIVWNCDIFRSDDGARTFRRLPLPRPPSAYCLSSVNFPSDQVGYVAGDSYGLRTRISATIDGGTSFSTRGFIKSSQGQFTLRFFNDSVGLALSNNGGELHRTEDGGRTWTLVKRFRLTVYGLELADSATAYAVSQEGVAVKTSDAGRTWHRVSLRGAPSGRLRGVRCSDAQSCLFVVDDRSSHARDGVLLTMDGGRSATAFSRAPQVRVADFAGAPSAVALGERGKVFSSETSGRTFSLVRRPTAPALFSGRLTEGPSGQIYAVGSRDGVHTRFLASSTDGGRDWRLTRLPGKRVLAVAFATARIGYAANERCLKGCTRSRTQLWRTVDGGKSWRRRAVLRRYVSALLAPTPTKVIAAGAGVVRSVDGGRSFVGVRLPTISRVVSYDFDGASGAAFIVGPRRVAVSRDGGARWSLVGVPRGIRIAEVDFPTRQVGYLRSSSGAVFRTSTWGRSWKRLAMARGIRAVGLSFSDALNGFVDVSTEGGEGLSPEARVLRTTDGGETLADEFVGLSTLEDLQAVGPSAAAAITAESLIWTDAETRPLRPEPMR